MLFQKTLYKEDEVQIATCGECWCFNRDGWCTLIDKRCDANDGACGRAMPIVEDAEREGKDG